MKAEGMLGHVVVLIITVCATAYATAGETVKLRRDLSSFPAGDYEVVWSYESEASEQLNDDEPRASKMEQVFTFAMKFEPPGESPELEVGRVDLMVKRIQVEGDAGPGAKMSYDSDGIAEDQTGVLAEQFKYIVGLGSTARIETIDGIGPFKGLDKGWDRYSEESDQPDVAAMNKKNYGDAMLDRVMKLGLEFLQDGPEREVGEAWEVTIERPGLRWEPRDVEHKCKLKSVKDGYAVIVVKWENNEMRPEVSPGGEMTNYGTEEEGLAGFRFHAKSLMLTGASIKTSRVDQVAGGEPGNINQLTRTMSEKKLLSIQPAATGEEVLPPEKVAITVLTAYKDKDLSELAKHSMESNAKMMEEIAREGKRHPRYKSLFGGSRWKSVAGWDGEVGEVRYASATKAWVSYSERDADAELFVVVLILEDGRWLFEDLNTVSKEDFEEAGTEP